MTSKRIHEGYLKIDHRNSPGIPVDLAQFWQANGKDALSLAEGSQYESATLTCCHCGTLVVLRPDRTRPRGYCRRCDHYVCDSPACVECRPFLKKIEDAQNQAYHLGLRGLTLSEVGLLIPESARRQ